MRNLIIITAAMLAMAVGANGANAAPAAATTAAPHYDCTKKSKPYGNTCVALTKTCHKT